MKLPVSFGATKSATAEAVEDDFFKTLNSVYFDSMDSDTTGIKEEDGNNDEVESIIRGAHLEPRLFFEPSTAKSISSVEGRGRPSDCVAMALESEDPYEDFKRSMEEMAALVMKKRDWGCLEDLLACYLCVNETTNHAYIIAAFVDLLLTISNHDDNSHINDGFGSSSRISSSSSCATGELLLHLPNSSSASCFSSSSPSN